MVKSAKNILKKAKTNRYAIGAFNVSSIDLLRAIFESAAELNSEVIIETSQGEAGYFMPEILFSITEKLSNMFGVNYALHLDRSNDFEFIKMCLDAGYNSVAAEFPEAQNLQEVVEKTLKAREITNKYRAQLEGSMDIVPKVYYSAKKITKLTDPDLVKDFAAETQIDSFCVSIGNQSGAKKSLDGLNFELLKKINLKIPDIPLVLHGGSFLSKETYKKAIDLGVSKINVNAENRIAFTSKLKSNIEANPGEYAPYRLLTGVKEEMKKIVKSKLKIFKN